MAVAVVCLGWFALNLLGIEAYDLYGRLRLSNSFGIWLRHGRGAVAARTEAEASGLIGRIEIPRVGMSAIIAEGSQESTLRVAVGHLPDSAFPGERGNVALAGHRETLFRRLRHLRERDRIVITTPDGVFGYQVESTRIVGPDDLEVLQGAGGPTLTLITCYPFDFVGRAPKRFVVRARQVDSRATS